MFRELRINVAVIAEKRQATSKWAEDYWVPTAVIDGKSPKKMGDIVRQTERATSYFMGMSEIYCHAKETESYIHNFESETPAIYVILRQDEEENYPLPWYVHAVTVSPYEAQDYADAAEDIIERVPMPTSIAATLMDFIDFHHEDVPFKKRKRTNFKDEQRQFGKDPIFLKVNQQNNSGGQDE